MTGQEYQDYYIDSIVTVLGPSVKREASVDLILAKDTDRQAILENRKNGLILISQIAFIESNFISSGIRELRNFGLSDEVPDSINSTHLSCFIYMRDCFAHNPDGLLFPSGRTNTNGFVKAVDTGVFEWCTIADDRLMIDSKATHESHLLILRFFGMNV